MNMFERPFLLIVLMLVMATLTVGLMGCDTREPEKQVSSNPIVEPTPRIPYFISLLSPDSTNYRVQTQGVTSVELQVQVKAQDLSLLDSVKVYFSAERGDIAVTQPITDSEGIAKATILNRDPSTQTPIFGNIAVTIQTDNNVQQFFNVIFSKDAPTPIYADLKAYNAANEQVYSMYTGIGDSIRIEALLTNIDHRAVPGVEIDFGLSGVDTSNVTLRPGPDEGVYVTDSNGEVSVYLVDRFTRQNAPTEPLPVQVRAGNAQVADSMVIILLPPPTGYRLVLSHPRFIYSGHAGNVAIDATLIDANGVAVPNQWINFSLNTPDYGSLYPGNVRTSAGGEEETIPVGVARTYFRPVLNASAITEPFSIEIFANFSNAAYAVSSLEVRPATYSIDVSAIPTRIKAGVEESALIQAYLTRDGSPLSGRMVDLYIPARPTDYTYAGQVNLFTEQEENPNTTNFNGIVEYFLGEELNPVPQHPLQTLVIAKNDTLGVRDSVFVTLAPAVHEMTIQAIPREIAGGIGDSSIIRIRMFRDGNILAGVPVNVSIAERSLAEFPGLIGIRPAPSVTNSNGVLNRIFEERFDIPPTEPAEVWVLAGNDSLGLQDSVRITILPPEDYFQLTVSTNRTVQNADGVGDSCRITATLTTVLDEPVPGQRIYFSTTDNIGIVRSFAVTDSLGRAIVNFHDGFEEPIEEAVVVQVTASFLEGRLQATTAPITILPWTPEPNALEVYFSTPRIQVVNTGGQEECVVQVLVLDQENNPIPYALVHFRMFGPNGGENLDGIGNETSVIADIGGIARVSIFSGTNPGTIRLDVRAEGMENWQTYRNVTIAAGPPHRIDIGFDLINMEANGGVFRVVCSALVRDVYTNPVDDSTVVYWSVDPPIATIAAYTWTSNVLPIDIGESGQGAGPDPGIAYTYVYANSNAAFETLFLTAVCDSVVNTTPMFFDISIPQFLYLEVQLLSQFVTLSEPGQCEDVDVFVRATDEFGLPQGGIVVAVNTLECGTILESPGITDATGIFQTTFRVCYDDFDTPGTYGCEIQTFQFDPLHPEINDSETIQVRVLEAR
ncbi:MAG: carboxypeptidase regulatory-like domain-containing protein [Gemmatimonadetes bacterium]|nr:MAG: carboxypeptidase regulatory-like domain-containing protein [Gemmatimonadota bacterium]